MLEKKSLQLTYIHGSNNILHSSRGHMEFYYSDVLLMYRTEFPKNTLLPSELKKASISQPMHELVYAFCNSCCRSICIQVYRCRLVITDWLFVCAGLCKLLMWLWMTFLSRCMTSIPQAQISDTVTRIRKDEVLGSVPT